MTVTTLRFANIIGPTANTPMTRFLSTPATPRLLGFDPMLQVIHEDDVIGALAHAVTMTPQACSMSRPKSRCR